LHRDALLVIAASALVGVRGDHHRRAVPRPPPAPGRPDPLPYSAAVARRPAPAPVRQRAAGPADALLLSIGGNRAGFLRWSNPADERVEESGVMGLDRRRLRLAAAGAALARHPQPGAAVL